jgi:hypothetical protein
MSCLIRSRGHDAPRQAVPVLSSCRSCHQSGADALPWPNRPRHTRSPRGGVRPCAGCPRPGCLRRCAIRRHQRQRGLWRPSGRWACRAGRVRARRPQRRHLLGEQTLRCIARPRLDFCAQAWRQTGQPSRSANQAAEPSPPRPALHPSRARRSAVHFDRLAV